MAWRGASTVTGRPHQENKKYDFFARCTSFACYSRDTFSFLDIVFVFFADFSHF